MPTERPGSRLAPAFGTFVVAGILFLLFGFGGTPASGNLVESPWDKLVHLGIFASLTFGLCLSLPRSPWPLLLLLASTVAVADELHQFLVPTRQPAWGDWLADLLGVGCGLLAWQSVRRLQRAKAGHPN